MPDNKPTQSGKSTGEPIVKPSNSTQQSAKSDSKKANADGEPIVKP